MKIWLRRDAETMVEKPGGIVGSGLGPAASRVVASAPVQSAVGAELTVKECYESFNFFALLEQRFLLRRVFGSPVAVRPGGDGNACLSQLLPFFCFGPVGAIADQVSAEGIVEQRIEAHDVVAVARDVHDVQKMAAGREDQVLAHSVEILLESGTVTGPGESAQAFLVPGPHYTADADRVRIDEGKRGDESASREAKARQSLCRTGVSSALRSANFWRVSRLGKSCVRSG